MLGMGLDRGIGRPNFKIGRYPALLGKAASPANFEIWTPDPNSLTTRLSLLRRSEKVFNRRRRNAPFALEILMMKAVDSQSVGSTWFQFHRQRTLLFVLRPDGGLAWRQLGKRFPATRP